jgi:plasmid maintenance system antidote protein VapI
MSNEIKKVHTVALRKNKMSTENSAFGTNPDFYTNLNKLDFAEMLFTKMQGMGMTKKAFAEHIGVSRQYLDKILNSQENMTTFTMNKIALKVGVAVQISFTHLD